ncbi:receptor protein [Salix suchowensis]|nr:receptor protein [Salix suchowensis]
MDGSEKSCREAMDDSTEEADLLIRSSKKVKIGDINGQSYVDKLMGETSVRHAEDEDNHFNECVSDDDDDESDEDDCPRIRAPWKQTLIIKLMGRKVGYMFFMQRLKNMWKLRGDFTLTDLGNDFYLAKFANTEDREHVLFGRPWMVTDHYLTVRTWHPNFDPVEATIDKVAVWVRLPNLALEYYDTSVLWKIGNKIGKTLKVDRTTSVGTRGNFARLCVEVDLTKPLLAKFKLRRRIRRIMYEGLHLICFHCGQYRHKQEICPHTAHESQDEPSEKEMTGDPLGTLVRPEIMDSYGAWMIADRRHRRPSKKTVVEENRGNGTGEVIAVNLGKKLKNTTVGSLIVSARYDALNASHEDLAEKRAGDSRGIQRAIIGPIDQRQEKSPQVEDPCGGAKIATGNNVQTKKNGTEKNYKVKDKKGGLKNVTERSKIAAAPVLIHATSVKGKEKVTGLDTETRRKDISSSKDNSSTMAPREEMVRRGFRTNHEFYRSETAQVHQTKVQEMEPLDMETWMEEGAEVGDEGDFMVVSQNPEEEMMVDEGETLMDNTGGR